MAEIRLGRNEVERGRLPKVCMVCGGRASVKRKRSFSKSPSWALLAGGVILASLLAKRMKINAPLCHAHRNHWLNRTLIITLTFVASFLVTVISLIVLAAKSPQRGQGDTALAGGFAIGVLLLLGWIILAVVLQLTAIRATDVTDKSLTLKNVSPSFIEELKDFREQRRNPTVKTSRVAKRRPEPDEEEDEDEEDDDD